METQTKPGFLSPAVPVGKYNLRKALRLTKGRRNKIRLFRAWEEESLSEGIIQAMVLHKPCDELKFYTQ